MSSIASLKRQIEQLESQVVSLEEDIQGKWNQVFNGTEDVQAAIKDLDVAGRYDTDLFGEFVGCAAFDLKSYKGHVEALKTYLMDMHNVNLNIVLERLEVNIGPVIEIDYKGRIFDHEAGKAIADAADYTDETGAPDLHQRNRLIEAYMESKGYFPAVIQTDRYGNCDSINTKE